jgi:hypothetical protein
VGGSMKKLKFGIKRITNWLGSSKQHYFYVLNFGEKNRDSKILGGGKRLFPPPLEKISLQLPFLAKNKKIFFQRL